MENHFITIEGPDGAGKTTIINAIKPWLKQKLGQNIIFTREPGGDEISEKIRNLILDPKNKTINKHTELLLYEAARSQLVSEILQPALKDQKYIICDRYIDSTIAYQAGGNNLNMKDVELLNQFATNQLMPALTIYYDVPVEVGLNRIHKYRTEKQDRLDQKTINYHQTVSETYHQVIAKNQNRIKVIDGTKSIETRIKQTKKLINQLWFN